MSLMDRNVPLMPGAPGIVDVGMSDMGDAQVIHQDDGGAIVEFGSIEPEAPQIDHGVNLIDVLGDDITRRIVADIDERVKADDESRRDWLETYRRGIELLGLKPEPKSEDYIGVTRVTHPAMAQACVRFWSFARAEMLPPSGPAAAEVLGDEDDALRAQAARVEDYVNYWATEEAEEYYPDDSQMFMYLPIGGTTFKKVYIDGGMGRATSRFIPPDDLIVNYDATSLDTADRITHVLRLSRADLRKLQVGGFWSDVPLDSEPQLRDGDAGIVRAAVDRSQGTEAGDRTRDRYEIHEVHANVDLAQYGSGEAFESAGIPVPMIVTYDKATLRPLAIRRNWAEGDTAFKRVEYFIRYSLLPGLGFYGIGFAHLLGGLAEATTGMLRSMLDAGLFANFPAGFKAKGLKLETQAMRLMPGQFADVDIAPNMLKEAIVPLPYRGVDRGAFELYRDLVASVEKLASTQSLPTGEMNPNAPVGTTLAILEEGGRLTNAVLEDLFVSRRKEFRILSRLFGASLPDRYPYRVKGGERVVLRSDFDQRIDVAPVAKAAGASKTQRIAMAQTEWGLIKDAAQVVPGLDLASGFRRVAEKLGMEDAETLLPQAPQAMTGDPATENITLLQGRPVRAEMTQQHQAHIAAHVAFGRMLTQNPVMAAAMQSVGPMLQAHVAEHYAMDYAVKMQMATGVPVGQQLPPEAERQAAVAVAQASEQVAQAMAGQEAAAAQQQSPELLLAAAEMLKAQTDARKVDIDAGLKREKMDLDEKVLATRLIVEAERSDRDREAKAAEGDKNRAVEIAKKEADLKAGLVKSLAGDVRRTRRINAEMQGNGRGGQEV